MTVYNHEEFVSQAIESVLGQSFKDYELIIINDGSTDRTNKVLEKFKQNPKIVIKNIQHVGRARALNIGFNAASGEYIALLDSDDLYLPEKIGRQVEYLNLHPGVAMVGTNSIEHDLVSGRKYLNLPPTADDDIRKLLLYDSAFPFPVVMVRAEILRQVGFCDVKLRSKIDFDLFGRIASKGKLANIPETMVIVNRHPKKYFRYSLSPEHHRKARLRVRWSNLWRLKPPFILFSRMLLWIGFEYYVNLFPEKVRNLIPNSIRATLKTTKLIHPVDTFTPLKTILDL